MQQYNTADTAGNNGNKAVIADLARLSAYAQILGQLCELSPSAEALSLEKLEVVFKDIATVSDQAATMLHSLPTTTGVISTTKTEAPIPAPPFVIWQELGGHAYHFYVPHFVNTTNRSLFDILVKDGVILPDEYHEAEVSDFKLLLNYQDDKNESYQLIPTGLYAAIKQEGETILKYYDRVAIPVYRTL